MCEGPSKICGPIPPDPTLFPEYYKRPASARARLEGNHDVTLALLSGPLAPDPVLYPGYYSARIPTPPPRIGSDATHILERGQRGVVGNLLKLEGVSLIPNTPKQKQLVRDYSKENVRRLREIQRRCKEDAEKSRPNPVPVKALWSYQKYQNVPSRVMVQLQESNPPTKPQCQNFLRAHSNQVWGPAGAPRPQRSASPSTLQRPASCSSTEKQELQLQIQGKTMDFIGYNARTAGRTGLRRSQSLTSIKDKPVPSAVKGQVPQYLEERKELWRREKEEKRRNAPDPTIPAGHTLMPEEERRETLQSLKETQQSMVTELLSIPVRADNLSIRNRRADLDRKLSELDEAIKIFSRDKVYVKTDS